MSIDPDESFSIPDLCRTLFETMPLGVVYQSTSGIIITANPAAQKILGLTLDQIQSRTSFDPNWRAIHEDGSDFPGEEHPSMLAIRTGSAVRDVVMGVFNPLTGGFTWINITAIPQFRNQGEPPDVVIVTFEDITERKQFERKIIQLKRLYATLSQVNQTVVRVKDRIDLYQSICNVAVQFGEFALAWVGLLDESSGEIRPVAANGLDVAQWPFELVNINQGSSKNGLVATAIRTSRVVTSEDIEVDNRVQSLQKQLLKYNFHSIAAIPFRLRDRAIGILALVSREAGLFKAVEELRLLEEMGLDISFALDMIETEAERKQAEQALKQSEAALQKAQQVAHVGSWAWRIPENRLEWSNEMYHIFGIDRASFTGQLSDVITHAIHPDDRAIVDQSNMSVVEKKTPIPLEYRVVWEDGTVRTVWAEAGELILDDEGRAALLTGIVQDITERKRAEKALYESEKRFFILFEKSSFAAALSRMPDGVLLAVNEAFEKTFGFTKQESIGRTSHDLGINPDAEGRSHILAALKAGGSARNVEMPFRTKSGEERIFSVNVDLVEISDQKYILNTTQDITERKRAEEQLARLVERFDLAARAAQLGVWDWSIANDQLVWDERMYELYGVKKEDFSGAYDAWLQGLHPDDRLGSFEISQQAIQREKEYGTEFRVIWPNGSIHWLKAYGQVIHDASGKPQRMIGVNFEITDQKSAEAKMLRQTERLKILADASLAFAAVSQDYQAVLDQVVHQVVNVMADMCQIRLISDDGQLLELASIYSRDIKYSEVFRSITTSASERSDDPGLAPHVFRTGEPALVPVLNVDQLRASVPPEYWPKYEHFLPHSYMIVALRVMGRSIGVMSLTRYQSEQPAFAQDDLDLVQDLASRAALAINNARLLSQLQDELTKRARIENDLRESENRYQKLLEVAPVGIAVHSEGRIIFTNPAGAHLLGAESEEQIIGKSILSIIHPDGLKEAQMRIQRMMDGELNLYPAEDTYLKMDGTPVDVEVMATSLSFGGKPAVQVIVTDITERKRAEEKIINQLYRLSALRTIDMAITSSLDLRVTLNVLLEHVLSQLGVDASAVLLLNHSLYELEYAAGRGFHSNSITRLRLKLGEDFAGKAALERRTIFIPNLNLVEYPFSKIKLTTEEKFISFYAIPLIAKGQVNGVLEVFHRTRLDPDSEWLDYLETLAGQAAIAIDNAQLYDGLQRSNIELALAYDATIEGWSRAMDLRDKETEGHTLRVTELTMQLARAAGMNSDQIAHVRRGALLHDMGKLGVPDSILFKPDKLSDDEWVLMRKHPQYAYDMLVSIEYLRPALDIPYCHHEKWDGTGYPRGLKGEQIPIAARLFAIVDVWDALRSDRPYRASWPEEKVLEYIRTKAGTHFDPKIVDLYFKVLSEK